MTADLVPMDKQLTILRGLVKAEAITPVSLDLDDPNLPFDRYEAIGTFLGAFGRSVRWWVGDWLIFGEGVYGELMAQALAATGLSEGTLLNYRYVCEHVPKSRRRLDLSFSTHYEVAALKPKEQRKWLALAAREQLSSRELRQRIKDSGEPQPEAAGEAVGAEGGAGRAAANPQLETAARNLWKHAQPYDAEHYLVPREFIVRLGALIGEGE